MSKLQSIKQATTGANYAFTGELEQN